MWEPDPVEQALVLLLEHDLLRARRLDGVWVFGSRAQGTANSASDVDLAVLCEPALELDRFRLIDSLGRAPCRATWT